MAEMTVKELIEDLKNLLEQTNADYVSITLNLKDKLMFSCTLHTTNYEDKK